MVAGAAADASGGRADVVDIWEEVLVASMDDEEFVAWAAEQNRPLAPTGADVATQNMLAAGDAYRENSDLLRELSNG